MALTLTILDPGMFGPIANYWGALNTLIWDGATDDLFDSAAAAPVFDTDHAVYTNPIVDRASQNSIGDNSAGLEDPLTLDPLLSYAYTTGYTNTRTTSQSLTVGLEQTFDYDFLGEGGSTKLTASGTFTWGQGSSENMTKTITEQLGAPFDIPKGRIYEEKLLFSQETAAVPYTTVINVEGQLYFIIPNARLGEDVGDVFGVIEDRPPPNEQPEPYKDVNWRDIHQTTGGRGSYLLHGTMTLEDAGNATVKIYDITNGGSQEVRAEYDAAVPVGVHRTMDDAGRTFHDTPFDDWVDGGDGHDLIRLRGGEDIAHAGGGNDTIRASGVGRSLLDGGDGDDVIRLTSTAAYSTVLGGAGNDRIHVNAPAAMLYGGAGDDRYWLNGATAGGTVITDAEGHNRLWIDNGGVTPGFERVGHGENLYILLGGGDTYDRARDVVWVDFFANPHNRIDGLRTAEVEEIATVFRLPPAPAPEADAVF